MKLVTRDGKFGCQLELNCPGASWRRPIPGSRPLLPLVTPAIKLGAGSGGSGAYDWAWRIQFLFFCSLFWPVSLHQRKIKRSLAKLDYRDRISPGSGVATTRTTVGFTVTFSGNRFLTSQKEERMQRL
jgi:hypothetical protein